MMASADAVPSWISSGPKYAQVAQAVVDDFA
jgi:hypothetical protein